MRARSADRSRRRCRSREPGSPGLPPFHVHDRSSTVAPDSSSKGSRQDALLVADQPVLGDVAPALAVRDVVVVDAIRGCPRPVLADFDLVGDLAGGEARAGRVIPSIAKPAGPRGRRAPVASRVVHQPDHHVAVVAVRVGALAGAAPSEIDLDHHAVPHARRDRHLVEVRLAHREVTVGVLDAVLHAGG